MIFLTVGSQLPFDRLVEAVDHWADTHKDQEIIAQTGRSNYRPRNFSCRETMPPPEYHDFFRRAQVVVAHAGTGVTVTAAEFRVPLIMLPRLSHLGEIRNNHQVHYIEYFRAYTGVYPATTPAEVCAYLDRIDTLKGGGPFTGASEELIAALKELINS